jgi:hypothetical protein
MQAVGVGESIRYGFKLMAYFALIILISGIITIFGSGMILSAQQGLYGGTDTGQLLIGLLISLGGVAVLYAGLMGSIYKVIADAVQRGNQVES